MSEFLFILIFIAFKYGTTLVPFTDEDKQNMDYQSGEKGMKVLGFTKAENVSYFRIPVSIKFCLS